MTLSAKQADFTSAICRLVLWALEIQVDPATGELLTQFDGVTEPVPRYRIRFGDAYRDPRAFGRLGEVRGYGAGKSLHKSRLAVDLILDRWDPAKQAYVYCCKTEEYRELGLQWLQMDERAEWGGAASRADRNHFSFRHQGRW